MTLGSQKGGQEKSLTTQMDGWRSPRRESASVGFARAMGTRSSLMPPLEPQPQNMLLSPLFEYPEALDQGRGG